MGPERSPSARGLFLGLEGHFAPRRPFLLREDGSRAVYGWQRSEYRLHGGRAELT